MLENQSILDGSDFIANYMVRMDFDMARREQLNEISQNIFSIFLFIFIPMFFIHLIISVFMMMKVESFRKTSLLDKNVHILCNAFFVFPHRDIDNNNSQTDHAQSRYFLLLHFVENVTMLFATKLYFYKLDMAKIFSFPAVYFDLCFVIPVVLGGAVAFLLLKFFYNNLDPWAFLPDEKPNFPDDFPKYSPEVCLVGLDFCHTFLFRTLS